MEINSEACKEENLFIDAFKQIKKDKMQGNYKNAIHFLQGIPEGNLNEIHVEPLTILHLLTEPRNKYLFFYELIKSIGNRPIKKRKYWMIDLSLGSLLSVVYVNGELKGLEEYIHLSKEFSDNR